MSVKVHFRNSKAATRPGSRGGDLSPGVYKLGFSSAIAAGDAIRAKLIADEHIRQQHGDVKILKQQRPADKRTLTKLRYATARTRFAIIAMLERLQRDPHNVTLELNTARQAGKLYRAMLKANPLTRRTIANDWGTSLSELEVLVRVYYARWKSLCNPTVEGNHNAPSSFVL